jgi:hypothetical protein
MPDYGLPSCAPNTSPNSRCQHQPLLCRLRGAESSRLSECVCAEGVFKRRRPALANTTIHPTASATSPAARDQEALPLHNCSRRKDTLSLMTSTSAASPTYRQFSGHQGQHNSVHTILHSGTPPNLQLLQPCPAVRPCSHTLTGMCLLSSFLSRYLHILGARPRSSCVGWFHPAVIISGDSTMQS